VKKTIFSLTALILALATPQIANADVITVGDSLRVDYQDGDFTTDPDMDFSQVLLRIGFCGSVSLLTGVDECDFNDDADAYQISFFDATDNLLSTTLFGDVGQAPRGGSIFPNFAALLFGTSAAAGFQYPTSGYVVLDVVSGIFDVTSFTITATQGSAPGVSDGFIVAASSDDGALDLDFTLADPVAVSEPGSLALFAVGLAFLMRTFRARSGRRVS